MIHVSSGLTIRSLIDPYGTLPKVELEYAGWNTEFTQADDYDIFNETQQIGRATIHDLGSMVCCFSGIEIDKACRGRGQGLATYVAAIELVHAKEKAFRNGIPLTKDSARIWNILYNAGVAEVLSPIKQYGDAYIGALIIPPR